MCSKAEPLQATSWTFFWKLKSKKTFKTEQSIKLSGFRSLLASLLASSSLSASLSFLPPFCCLCCLSLDLSSPPSASLHSLKTSFFFYFGLSRVGWGQGSEKLIPHNPLLPGQVAASFPARTRLHKHTRQASVLHSERNSRGFMPLSGRGARGGTGFVCLSVCLSVSHLKPGL